jgi:DNA-binding FrmR family transcriptional regulator
MAKGKEQQNPELDEIQKNVISRLRRIEGQVRGLQRMVNEGKECEDILIQVRAVRSALKSTTKQILRRYITVCHDRAMKAADQDEAYEQMERTAQLLNDFLEG